MNTEILIAELNNLFPNVWAKNGEDFRQGALVWSGEGSEVDNINAFDYWVSDPGENTYVMGIHKKLHEWALKHGCYWECHDPGTYLLYKI